MRVLLRANTHSRSHTHASRYTHLHAILTDAAVRAARRPVEVTGGAPLHPNLNALDLHVLEERRSEVVVFVFILVRCGAQEHAVRQGLFVLIVFGFFFQSGKKKNPKAVIMITAEQKVRLFVLAMCFLRGQKAPQNGRSTVKKVKHRQNEIIFDLREVSCHTKNYSNNRNHT